MNCPKAQGTIIDVHIENCIFINVIVVYFVFSAVFIGEGQNLTVISLFGLIYISLCKLILNYYIHMKI